MAASEEWRPVEIPGADYPFEVSSLGRLRRSAVAVTHRHKSGGHYTLTLPTRLVAQAENKRGYMIATPQLGYRRKRTLQVAPLVCRAFNGPAPKDGMHCAHLNGNSRDNRPNNLAWATPVENEAHKAVHGTSLACERHHQARLTPEQVSEILSEPRGHGTGVVLARKYGVSPTQISDIRNGKSWGRGNLHILGGCVG